MKKRTYKVFFLDGQTKIIKADTLVEAKREASKRRGLWAVGVQECSQNDENVSGVVGYQNQAKKP